METRPPVPDGRLSGPGTAARCEPSPRHAPGVPGTPLTGLVELQAALAACARARGQLEACVRRSGATVERSRRRWKAAERAAEREGRAAGPAPRRDFEADLIREHIGLARHLAARYYRRGEAADDLEQVAFLALVRAARRWDPDRGIPFSGYASPSILGEIKRYFRDRSWSMRVPAP